MKRGIDVILVVGFAPVWVPLLLITAVLVVINLGTPVFFTQERGGRNGQIFRIIKFRSMRNIRDEHGKLSPDAERLTSFGRWLRATSLDELPELLNVVRGDMSLVGPRPLLAIYLPRYTRRQARRHEVRPGLTGLAQVMGRNSLTWEEKFEWDLRYVETQSLWLDLKILGGTMVAIFLRRGVSAPGNATMPEFSPVASERDSRQNANPSQISSSPP